MSTWRNFEDIDAWQQARLLANAVYDASERGRFARDFALVDQVRRAAISIMSNIAEGFERESTREFIRFLIVAKASTAELRSHLYLARDRRYLTAESFEQISKIASRNARIIGGLVAYLRRRSGQRRNHGAALS